MTSIWLTADLEMVCLRVSARRAALQMRTARCLPGDRREARPSNSSAKSCQRNPALNRQQVVLAQSSCGITADIDTPAAPEERRAATDRLDEALERWVPLSMTALLCSCKRRAVLVRRPAIHLRLLGRADRM